MTVTCFDIGGTYIRYGNLQSDGLVKEAGRVAVPHNDWDAFSGAIADGVAKTKGSAVSISITGSYDPQSGLATVANLPCVDGRFFAADLKAVLGKPVLVTNDADCFALAEATFGDGAGSSIVFAIILGSGVGGGIVANGAILRGFGGVTGEWGHGPVFTHGPAGPGTEPLPCGCGVIGCMDVIGSARGLENIHQALHGVALKSHEITTGWTDKKPEQTATVDRWLDLVSRHLAMLANTIGPTFIPVGGGLSNDAELIAALDEAVRARTNAIHNDVLVKPGKFVKDGGLIGAGIAAKHARLDASSV